MTFPLPTPAKTWDAAVSKNNLVDSTGFGDWTFVARRFLRRLKDVLCDAGLATRWHVWQSCGYVSSSWTVGVEADGVDNWPDDAAMQYAGAGSNHSWVVLQLTYGDVGEHVQLCIDYASSNWHQVTIVLSPGANFGVAGGGVAGDSSHRPTAPDEVVIASDWAFTDTDTPHDHRLHAWVAPDGELTRVVGCNRGATNFLLIVDKLASARPDWLTDAPWHAGVAYGAFGNPDTLFSYTVRGSIATRGRFNGGAFVGRFSYEAWSQDGYNVYPATQACTRADSAGGWSVSELGLWADGGTVAGKLGKQQDIWLAPHPNGATVQPVKDGDTHPADASRHFVCIGGAFIMPWDTGAAPGAGTPFLMT